MKPLDLIRHCSICHCWPNLYLESVCEKCWKTLLLQTEKKLYSSEYNFSVYRLWRWNKNNLPIQSFLYSLKKGWATKTLKSLARCFLNKQKIDINFKNTVIVPSPKKIGQKKDHASVFSKHLSVLRQIPVNDILQRGFSKEDQKTKGRKQREKTNMVLLKKPSHKNIIFVDDVITSGSTALAAYKALGSPKNFQVWVVAERLKQNL